MGGKYEVRYFNKDFTISEYTTDYTNSWLEFMRLRLTNKVIYYKVYKH